MNGCEICGACDEEFFLQAQGVALACDRQFRLVRCRNCGLIYLSPQLSREELAGLDFKELHGEAANFLAGFSNFILGIFMSMRRIKMGKLKSPPGAVLDVGSGRGLFLKSMLQAGWDGYGTDVSSHAISAAERNSRLKIFCGELEKIDLPEKFFDLVTFWQSFEHLAHPAAVLKKAHTILKDDGLIIISVPNIESLEAKISLRLWFGLELPGHCFQYSPKTLKALLEKNNFRLISLCKNSLEYNFAFFAQTFLNAVGAEFNFLHNLFKRHRQTTGRSLCLRLYTLWIMFFVLPLLMPLGLVLYIINILSHNGPVIEVVAGKQESV